MTNYALCHEDILGGGGGLLDHILMTSALAGSEWSKKEPKVILVPGHGGI
jgi:hypothetical protein